MVFGAFAPFGYGFGYWRDEAAKRPKFLQQRKSERVKYTPSPNK